MEDAYGAGRQGQDIPLESLQRALSFPTEEDTAAFVTAHCLEVSHDKATVKFKQGAWQEPESRPKKKSVFASL